MKKKVYTRPQAEAEFVHALTRQVGYTAGAFSIQRMADIVSLFEDASAYQFELVKRLTSVSSEGEPLSEKYATDVLSFAAELGIVSKLPGASVPHLSRFVLSDAGVAIRAARAVAPDLESLILEHLILENDADAYLRVLSLLHTNSSDTAETFANDFRDAVLRAREVRLQWLKAAFPSKPVLLRLIKCGSAQVHWLKVKKLGLVEIERPGTDFGRHHFSPRKTWTGELGHFDALTKQLTPSGLQFMNLAGWSSNNANAHWISPPAECLNFLRVPETVRGDLCGPSAPTLDLLRPSSLEYEPTPELTATAAEFLRAAFDHIKLVHARQALTSPLKYFLVAQERVMGRRLDLELILQTVSRTYPKDFAFFSSRSGALAYYQVRRTESG